MNATVLCFPLLLAGLATGATVETKAGESVQGEILGKLAFKSAAMEVAPPDSTPRLVAFYLVCPGHMVEAVSQAGVNLGRGELTLLLVSWDAKKKAPSDLEALAAAEMETGLVGIAMGALPSGADVTHLKMRVKEPASVDALFAMVPGMMITTSPSLAAVRAAPKLARVLGTLGVEQGKPSLTPVEVKTPTGITSLPATSIVDFETGGGR